MVVFRALTYEKELTQWFPNERAILEPQVGPAWMFKNYHSDTGEIHTARDKVLEIIQEKKCFTHGMLMSMQAPNRQSSRGRLNPWTEQQDQNNACEFRLGQRVWERRGRLVLPCWKARRALQKEVVAAVT